MRKCIMILISALLILALFPVQSMAEKPNINLGGKLGFAHPGMKIQLKPKLKNVDRDELKWASSDESVVSVQNGLITTLNPGRAIISVTDGNAIAKCGVVVLPERIDMNAGQSVNLPNGTLEKYAVQDASVIKISSKGRITALSEGESLVRIKYGKQTLYVQVNVRGEDTEMNQSSAANLDCADISSQIVYVKHESGSRARLSIHEKKDGVWQELYACTAYIGKNGIGKTREGDNKTPVGTFNLCQPFGIYEDPGANMDYTQVTKYHYWCGTSGSRYYNQMVDTRLTDRPCTSSDEYLINYRGEYNYCMFIDYNSEGEAGKGSCIFLHCTGRKENTAGCVAVPEKVMKKIIQWAKPGAKIVIE